MACIRRNQLAFGTAVDLEPGTVRISGELDLAVGDRLQEPVRALLAGGLRVVTLDFADVTFIDAAGLGAVVGVRNLLLRSGSQLALRNLPDRVAWVFMLGGLEALLRQH